MNKVETAVRMKHIPTGVSVRCEVSRTQGENKVCLTLLGTSISCMQTQVLAFGLLGNFRSLH